MATVSDTPPKETDYSSLRSRQSSDSSETPPKRTAPPRATGSGAGGRQTAQDKMEAKLAEFFGTVGMITAAFNQRDGLIIMENAQSLALNWTALAQENKAVKHAIDALLETGAWSGAIMATAAVAIPIMDNHGYIPARFRSFAPGTASAGAASDMG